jgi:acetyl esterase/lipase
MRIPLFSLLLIVIGACTKPQYNAADLVTVPLDTSRHREPVETPPLAYEEFINLHYGDDPLQTIDLYLPKGRTADTTHIMVFIHGGGWMGSDKSDYTNAIDSMKHVSASYAYVNINYRLVVDGRNQFPTAEEDVQAALEYVWKRVDSFHISPRTGIIGVSAGAHLTALEAYKHNDKGYIKAITLFFGVYNMAEFYEQGSAGVPQLSIMVLGGTPQEKPDIYKSSSPLNFVTANSPATLLIHGTEDSLARYQQSVALDSALQKNGVDHYFFSFKGWHGLSPESVDEAAYRMFTWIAKYTK